MLSNLIQLLSHVHRAHGSGATTKNKNSSLLVSYATFGSFGTGFNALEERVLKDVCGRSIACTSPEIPQSAIDTPSIVANDLARNLVLTFIHSVDLPALLSQLLVDTGFSHHQLLVKLFSVNFSKRLGKEVPGGTGIYQHYITITKLHSNKLTMVSDHICERLCFKASTNLASYTAQNTTRFTAFDLGLYAAKRLQMCRRARLSEVTTQIDQWLRPAVFTKELLAFVHEFAQVVLYSYTASDSKLQQLKLGICELVARSPHEEYLILFDAFDNLLSVQDCVCSILANDNRVDFNPHFIANYIAYAKKIAKRYHHVNLQRMWQSYLPNADALHRIILRWGDIRCFLGQIPVPLLIESIESLYKESTNSTGRNDIMTSFMGMLDFDTFVTVTKKFKPDQRDACIDFMLRHLDATSREAYMGCIANAILYARVRYNPRKYYEDLGRRLEASGKNDAGQH
ncbi:hypothetical protein PAPHI01_2235 [Pancytospora philotis]|nr:hypothetical protein PAPHI01_2235 [Pancytospora philotis]